MYYISASDKLQKKYADLIKNECMTGDKEADHISADDTLIRFLKAIGCRELAEAWENVGKYYA
jgi:hypothetical protein